MLYYTGNNGQCLLAFNLVGKHHVTLDALSVSTVHGAWKGRVYLGFCKSQCVLGWRRNMACWSGMNWLTHCVPERNTQVQEW